MTGSGLAGEQASWFLAGVLLLRLAEQLSRPAARPGTRADRVARPDNRDPAGGARLVIVIAVPGIAPRSGEAAGAGQPAFPAGPGRPDRVAAWFGSLLEDLRLAGADIVVAPAGEGDRSAPGRPPDPVAAAVAARPVSAASVDAASVDAAS